MQEVSRSRDRSVRTVMVVGGYGQVGRRLCAGLSARRDIRLVVAGRRLGPARLLAGRIGAEACRLDVADPASWGPADSADVVVTCIDAPDGALAERVVRRGGGYIDLTAGDALFQDIERRARGPGYALLSVGLAPGLSNLMAAAVAARLERVDQIRIGLLFGLGDRHGSAGLDWMVDQAFRAGRAAVTALDFGAPWGVRRVHAFDFADQHVLRRTLGIPAVTGICFDSPTATELTFALVDGASRSPAVRAAVRRLLPLMSWGSRACNVSVTARGLRDGRPVEATLRFHGENESLTTGRLAAQAVERCLDHRPPPGAWHSHEVFDPPEVMGEAFRLGIGRFEGLARITDRADAPSPPDTAQEPKS